MQICSRVTCCLLPAALLAGCVSTPGTASSVDFGRPAKVSKQSEAYNHAIASAYFDRLGRFKEAQAHMEEIPRLDPNALSPTLRLIRHQLRRRQYDEALEMAERAIKSMPEEAELWVTLGEIYHQLERYDEAVNAFSKAIDLNPDNMLGYGALVDLQESTNDLVAAVDIYKRLIELTPDSAPLHYQLGLNLIRINDPKGATKALERTLELNPNLVRAYYMLGTLLLEEGDNEEAARVLTQYLRRRPGDTRGAENLLGALVRLDRYTDAKGVLRLLLTGQNREPRHNVLAMYTYLMEGDYAQAEEFAPRNAAPYYGTLLTAIARKLAKKPYLSKLEDLDAINAEVYDESDAYLNDLLYVFGEEETSAWLDHQLAALHEEAPGVRTVQVIRGQVLMKRDAYEDAAALFEAMLANDDPDPKMLHYYLAICYEELDSFEDTESHLTAYLDFDPDDPDILNFLGYLYAEEGVKLDEAERLLEEALALDPENPFYLDSLGWVYYKRGQSGDAIDFIQRAIYGNESDDAILRDHLGDAYLLNGDLDRAVAEWERSYRLDPTQESVQEKLKKHRPEALR